MVMRQSTPASSVHQPNWVPPCKSQIWDKMSRLSDDMGRLECQGTNHSQVSVTGHPVPGVGRSADLWLRLRFSTALTGGRWRELPATVRAEASRRFLRLPSSPAPAYHEAASSAT